MKNKWNGTKITINYIGNLDDKFGVKKKRIILNEDKMEPFINYSIFNNIISPRQKIKNAKTFYRNYNTKSKGNNNEKTIFNSLNIRDWEKVNNYNFYNFFNNFKYFHRVNNSKRILSTNNRLKLNKNKSSIILFGNEINKDDNQESNHFSAKRNKNKDFNMVKYFNKTKKEKLSKKNIRQIISSFNSKKLLETKEFNKKNKIINENIRAQRILLNPDMPNVNINFNAISIKKIKTANIFNNENYNNNFVKNNNNKNYYYSGDNKRVIKNKNNINIKKHEIFNSNNHSNSHIKIFVNHQNNNIINNINIISPSNEINSTNKKVTFCDASTNTELRIMN